MISPKKYQLLNRSSDLAIKVSGGTQGEVLANSAFALFDLMTHLETVEEREPFAVEAEGVDRNDLFVNWMRELLYLYQTGGYLLKKIEILETRDNYVKGEAQGEKFDPDRHVIQREIKAVIAQHCRMEKTGEQWIGRVIFEI